MNDYQRVARAIEFITSNPDNQPSLQQLADHLHLSPYHVQRLFARWAGVSPKRFLEAVTLERAKQLLRQNHSTLETSQQLGLGSASRVYDHFVNLEAVTPSQFKLRGQDLHIQYLFADSPYGEVFIASTERGICRLAFVENDHRDVLVEELQQEWPLATLSTEKALNKPLLKSLFNPSVNNKPLSLYVKGTNFQINVWKALLRLEPGQFTSYGSLAAGIGKPQAARAVGTAVGANPVALLIPCHRVIQQSGGLGGYHWGTTRKRAILTREFLLN